MKRLLLIIILTVTTTLSMVNVAQSRGRRLSDEDRQKYLIEMRNQKHEFLVRELELTRDQQNAFFPLYDKMDDELTRIGEEIRQLESKVSSNPKATDTEIESASRAVFEQKMREGTVELEYFDQFKEILKPKQLLSLKNAERKFTQQLVKQHGRVTRQ